MVENFNRFRAPNAEVLRVTGHQPINGKWANESDEHTGNYTGDAAGYDNAQNVGNAKKGQHRHSTDDCAED